MDADIAQYERVSWGRSQLLDGTATGKTRWPRSRWRWLGPLLFLIPLVLIALWAVNHIQGDVEAQAKEILDLNGIDTSGLEFDATYRDVEVKGDLPAGVTRTEVENILQTQILDEDDDLYENDGDINDAWVTATPAAAPVLGPINASVSSDGESIVLAGVVPTQENRDDLISAAEATGLPVDFEGLTASGSTPSSDDDSGQIQKMSAVMGGLTAGAFTAAELRIGDDGPVTGTIDAASQESKSLLDQSSGDGVTVGAPPDLGGLNTEVNFDGSRIVLNGTVLTGEHSATLEAEADGVVGADNVVNNLEISGLDEAVPGADDRVGALAAVIGTFGGLNNADAVLNDTDLTVNGEARDEDARTASVDAVSASEAAGLRPGGEITVAEAEVSLQEEIDLLQAELDALQEEIAENVVFASNSAELTDTAKVTLDKVIDAMQRYPRPVVETGGHTDSQGDDAFNIDLSQRRADSVVEYVGAQTSPDRLKPIGFGEAQPVAENTTEEGRLQNRRVEFIAKESF